MRTQMKTQIDSGRATELEERSKTKEEESIYFATSTSNFKDKYEEEYEHEDKYEQEDEDKYE